MQLMQQRRLVRENWNFKNGSSLMVTHNVYEIGYLILDCLQ